MENGRLDKDAYQRGQQLPGKEPSGSRGRGGRGGGFGRGRGRGRGGGGDSGGKQERAATFNSSSPQQEPAEELCHMCVTLGHKGRYAMHTNDSCPNKAKYERQMRDPEQLARLVQRLAHRVAEQETSGSPSAKSQPTPTQPQRSTAPPPAQHPPLPVSEYRFPYHHHVPPWQAGAGHMGAAGSFAPPTYPGPRQANFSQTGYPADGSEYNPSFNPYATAATPMPWHPPPWAPSQGGPSDGPGNTPAPASSSSAPHDRRQHGTEGHTAQSASVARAIDPTTFQRMYRQNGNLLTSPAGQQFVMFSGEFPTEEAEPCRTETSRRVAHTASVSQVRERLAEETSEASAAARAELFPWWILQRYSQARADESRSFQHELRQLTERADQTVHERIDDVTGVLGRVDGDGQCLMHTLRTAAGSNEHPHVLQTKFLEEIQQQTRTLLGIITASEIMRDEYDLDLDSPSAVANFAAKYIACLYKSGCSELLWAATRWQHHVAIVSHVTNFQCYVNTGLIFPNN